MLARIRQPEKGVTEAAQVYVCEPPAITPTGRYLGTVGFQRLLREPPSVLVGHCIEESSFVRPELAEREVATRLAAYNLVGVAVCDDAGRCSARSPSTTCSTACCRRTGESEESEYADHQALHRAGRARGAARHGAADGRPLRR